MHARQQNAADMSARAKRVIDGQLRRWDAAVARIHAAGINDGRLRAMLRASLTGGGDREATERGRASVQAQLATVEALLREAERHALELKRLRKHASKLYWFKANLGRTGNALRAYLQYLRFLVSASEGARDWHDRRLRFMNAKMVLVEDDSEHVESEPGDHEVGGVAFILQEQAKVVPATTAMFVGVYRETKRWPLKSKAVREALAKLNKIDKPHTKRPTKLAREVERVTKAMGRFDKKRPTSIPVVKMVVKDTYP